MSWAELGIFLTYTGEKKHFLTQGGKNIFMLEVVVVMTILVSHVTKVFKYNIST